MTDNDFLKIPGDNRDPVELARILSTSDSELSKKELRLKKIYEQNKSADFDSIFLSKTGASPLQGKTILYDLGYNVSSNEMKRSFYLKERLNSLERSRLIDLTKILSKASYKNKLFVPFAVLGVGTSTYSDEYFNDLEKYFLEKGFTKDEQIFETAGCYGTQFIDFKTYEDYISYCKKENASRAFDEQLEIVSEEKYLRDKAIEQKEYTKKKSIRPILEMKGEDLDFVVCLDEGHSSSTTYYKKKFEIFKHNFIDYCSQLKVDIKQEGSYLWGADYYFNNGRLERWKEIGSKYSGNAYRISFEEGRSFHFYFRANENAVLKVRDEILYNAPFVQLVRSSAVSELEQTILEGEKTGDYESILLK